MNNDDDDYTGLGNTGDTSWDDESGSDSDDE